MTEVEAHNLREIESLNQRGGRTLSIIDLIDAGTITPEIAALCWRLVGEGQSFMTGAVPGGVGKTTLMAACLAFLPPGERIITTSGPGVARRAAENDAIAPYCLLAHEIGQGRWYGYIWGREAQDFFSVRPPGRRVTCLHADTPGQARAILDQCGVPGSDVDSVGMQMFIMAAAGPCPRRRLRAMHCRVDGRLVPVYEWDEEAGRYERRADMTATACARDRREEFLTGLQREGVRDYDAVRARIVEFYRADA